MNLFFYVEGSSTEFKVYQKWVKYFKPNLDYIDSIDQYDNNKYFIKSGGGIPQMLQDNLVSSVKTVNDLIKSGTNIYKFIFVIDVENRSPDDVLGEVDSRLKSLKCLTKFSIVIQNYCIESWALGNRSIFPRHPSDSILRDFKNFYDVSSLDPEKMPNYDGYPTKALFSKRYLKKIANNYRSTYSTTNPNFIMTRDFFTGIMERHNNTSHINSFNSFLEAFL